MDHDHVDTKVSTTFETSEVLILVTITTVSAFIIFKWKQRNLEKAAAKIPGPPGLPIIGNTLEFWGTQEDVFKRFCELTKQYGPTTRIWFGPILLIYVSKPEDIQTIVNSRHALEKGFMYKYFREYVRNGLVTAPVVKWRKHRQVIQPVFNMKLIEQFIPVFSKYNNDLLDKLKPHVNGSQFDIWNYIVALNLDIICDTALGINENTQAHLKSEFAEGIELGVELLMTRPYNLWLHPDFIFYTMIKFKYGFNIKEKLMEKIFRLPNAIIKKKKEEFECRKESNNGYTAKPEPKSKVFIDILLELSDVGANFSDTDLLDEVLTMIYAGFDTTAQTISFCLLMLAIHQDIQEKVYEEIFGICEDSDHDVTVQDLKQMFYTEMAIKETLRRFPTVPIFYRTLAQDIDLTDHKLPAGCNVGICVLPMHMDPKVFANPEKFNPENFTPQNIAKRHTYSYIPFSAGSRNCIGSAYAMVSMKTTIAALVRTYRFYTDIKMEDIKLTADILLRSFNGYPVRIVKRK